MTYREEVRKILEEIIGERERVIDPEGFEREVSKALSAILKLGKRELSEEKVNTLLRNASDTWHGTYGEEKLGYIKYLAQALCKSKADVWKE